MKVGCQWYEAGGYKVSEVDFEYVYKCWLGQMDPQNCGVEMF